MLFIVGGVPRPCFDSILTGLGKALPEHRFIGKSLVDRNGQYEISEEHCLELVRSTVDRWQKEQDLFSRGVGIVLLRRPNESPRFRDLFFPFSLVAYAASTEFLSRNANRNSRIANDDRAVIAKTIVKLIRATSAVKSDVESRLERSPILLPVANFQSAIYQNALRDLATGLPDASDPIVALQHAFKTFEEEHSFRKQLPGGGRGFVDGKGVDFKMPGRALHGVKHYDANHPEKCLLAAEFRLGARIPAGFHFDCTLGGRRLSGSFPNCHLPPRPHQGNPHLNIYPNDFIR